MKIKTHSLSLLIILFAFDSFAQNANNNMMKYVYYKQRFLEAFIHVGHNQGESVPFDVRCNSYYSNDIKNKIGLGDATIRLGYYIATLATEYNLLTNNNQNTFQTRKELYYALEAFNRLDYTAEGHFGGTNELNGFFIRDDVPVNFIYQPSHQHLINSSPYSTLQMDSAVGDFIRASPTGPRHSNLHYCDEMSKDQMYTILWSMAMVKKCVDANANFNNSLFLDGLTASIRQEALEITRRIMDMLKENDYKIRNPVFGTCAYWTDNVNHYNELACVVGKNANCQDLSWGIANLASWILDEVPTSFYKWNTLIPITYAESIWQYCGYNQIFNIAENYKMIELATVANNWFENDPATYTMNAFQDILYNTSGIEEIAGINNLSLNFPQLVNDTRLKIKHGSTLGAVQAPIYYLMHCFLHDKSADLDFDDAHFEDFLNLAPCEGPYNNGPSAYGSFEWSSNDRWVHPEKRGDVQNAFYGEYCGLDYMLLFNMYCLMNPGYQSYSFESNNLTVPNVISFPFLTMVNNSPLLVGSNLAPATLTAFQSISSAASVLFTNSNFYGNLTYKSPSIRLTSGFNVEAGAKFHALAEPLSCDINGLYKSNANEISWSNGGNDRIITNYENIIQTTGKPPLVKKYTEESISASSTYTTYQVKAKKNYVEKPEIYPNPATNELNIILSGNAFQKIELRLHDMIGNLVIYKEVNLSDANVSQISKMNLNEISEGIYLLEIKGDNIDYKTKVVKATN